MSPLARGALVLTVLSAALSPSGCGSNVDAADGAFLDPGGGGRSCIVERVAVEGSIERIDLLLALDNSRSMADKQVILALAVPDLVRRLVNPPCLDLLGQPAPAAQQPGGPTAACPPGTRREMEPVLDIHIGVISSSIGSAGADACIPGGGKSQTVDDHGHLLSRLVPDVAGAVPTYGGKGFLAWDPTGELVDGDGAPAPGQADAAALIQSLTDMVVGVGQVGCGYEAQLESWYRFLVDPAPYQSISIVDGKATPTGLDETLLAQRADFLRPNSLLAIVMLTDENDCSIREYGQYFFAAQLQQGDEAFHLPRARAECAEDPADPCCKSCAQDPGSCPPDPTCDLPLAPEEDDANLRCWDQKRRFGIDFLYPTDRYVSALRDATVATRTGELVANPLFSDLDPDDGVSFIREPDRVILAGIVGVPWQDIARDPEDLTRGFKDADELAAIGADGLSVWDAILGDPGAHLPPADPLMNETYLPRSGTNPITGDAVAPPGSPNGTNPINGHEYTIAARDDLQYACIFPLQPGTERDCGPTTTEVSCDCAIPSNDNPLCEANPNDFLNPTLQVRAKAYPGLRELAVLRAADRQGIVASVCPRQLVDLEAADFGYRPAMNAIVDRLKRALGGQCLPRSLAPGPDGRVDCTVIEARSAAGSCTCDPAQGRRAVAEAHACLVENAKQAYGETQGWDCFCEVDQLAGPALAACQTDPAPAPEVGGDPVEGWCYVDAMTTPPTGSPALVEACPASERRMLRFVGGGAPAGGATVLISCGG